MPIPRSAIIAALKATSPPKPAAAVPGTSISGGMSPLVASYGEWTAGRAGANSTALPRDWFTFLSGAFSPLAPLQPVPLDSPPPGEDRPYPRVRELPVGWNLPMGMPGTERIGKLADFQALRTISDLYSVARACIDLRKNELRGIGWDIIPTKQAGKAMRGDSAAMADFADRKNQATAFFRKPDSNFNDFTSWFDSLLEEVFVTDALATYPHPSRMRGKGLLGSNIAELTQVDGTLIRPLATVRGGRPKPPNPAWQQYLYGVPRVDLMSIVTGDDLTDSGMDAGDLAAEYTDSQLMYLPFSPRVWSPYGQAPAEKALIPIMTGLRKQQFQLDFFDQGSIPGLFVSPGDPNMTPQQIRELQDALNGIAGDQAWKHKIIVLPGGSKVDPQRQASLADQFDEIVMVSVCMAYSVMPMELGISPKVSNSQSPGAANQMAKASQNAQERKGTVPLLEWLANTIFNFILQQVCGQDDMQWQWEGLEEDEDAETLTTLIAEQVGAGLLSIDEGRNELGREPWGLPATSDPGWATQMNGFMPFTSPNSPLNAPPPAPPQPGLPPGQQQKPALPAGQQKPALPAAAPAAKPGQPASQQQTPAHAAATQAATQAPGSSSQGPGSGSGKEQARELDLLRSHLRKGHPLTTWQPRHLPPGVLAGMARDLAHGIPADGATLIAKARLTATADTATAAVHAYLARNYPETVLGWVDGTDWEPPAPVPLARINGARRKGGPRDQAKVDAIAQRIRDGKPLDPLVLVDVPGKDRLQVADGWHRIAAYHRAGKMTALAWVGHATSDTAFDPVAMGEAKLNKAAKWPGWNHDEEAAAAAAAAITAAATSVNPVIRDLVRDWRAGKVTGSAADITARIQAITADTLRQPLTSTWAAGWKIGTDSAATITGHNADNAAAGIPSGYTGTSPETIAGNNTDDITAALEDAEAGGMDPDEAASAVIDALGLASRADGIGAYETASAIMNAALAVYQLYGVTATEWSTAGSGNVCSRCASNELTGPVATGEPYPDGSMSPPAHTNCRCTLIPSSMPGVASFPSMAT